MYRAARSSGMQLLRSPCGIMPEDHKLRTDLTHYLRGRRLILGEGLYRLLASCLLLLCIIHNKILFKLTHHLRGVRPEDHKLRTDRVNTPSTWGQA
jgi:hypothetical protein